MNEQDILRLAEGEIFTATAIIPVSDIVVDYSFRPYCEENLCGQYGVNYSCPPECGAPMEMEARLRSAWRGRLLREEERLRSMEKTLQLLSPETIYRKGYTLTRQEGRTVRSASELQKGSVIETEWLDSSVRSEVL